jgi:hypothetical protein
MVRPLAVARRASGDVIDVVFSNVAVVATGADVGWSGIASIVSKISS